MREVRRESKEEFEKELERYNYQLARRGDSWYAVYTGNHPLRDKDEWLDVSNEDGWSVSTL